jgi:hypothetical protein
MQTPNLTRIFEDRPATREEVPLWLGLFGPSNSGKTFSALRLATGIQRVTGGEIFVVDTEARRSLAYADKFKFRYIDLAAPFSPLDYLAAVEHCVSKGARVIIVDSMSHEHEGPGGLLEWHASELERLCDNARRRNPDREPDPEKYKMLAWQAPKAARTRMKNTFLQMRANFIFCFRAKEKLKIIPGRTPENQGFMPIGWEEFIFDMMETALLLPGAYGVPTWRSKEVGETMMIKDPDQFHELNRQHAGKPLSEGMGEFMANWAKGDKPSAPSPEFERLSRAFACAPDDATIKAIGAETVAAKKVKSITPTEAETLRLKAGERRRELAETPKTHELGEEG